jgi:ATP-dependent helicase/nuclease subunit A
MGLEFPVVVVPELGAGPRRDAPPALLEVVPDGRGGERPEVGLSVPDPARGHRVQMTALRRILHERVKAKEDAEAKRLLYVACTRARDHLLLVGSARQKDGVPAPRKGSWLDGLLKAVPVDAGALEVREARVAGRGVTTIPVALVLAADLPAPPAVPVEPPLVLAVPGLVGEAAAVPREAVAAVPVRFPGLAPLPASPRRPRLSPSSWATLRQCGQMYKLRHVLRLPESGPALVATPGAGARTGEDPRALLRGSVIHRLLEDERRADELFLGDEVERAIAALADEGASGAVAGEADRTAVAAALTADARRALATFAGSALAREVKGADEVRREQPFALELRNGAVEGTIDLLFKKGPEWSIVDYKSNAVAAEAVKDEVLAHGYDLQMGLYALAVSRLFRQASVRTTLFFTTPGVAHEETFDAARLDEVQGRVDRDLAKLAALDLDRPERAPCATCAYAASGVCDRADPGLRRPVVLLRQAVPV